MEQRRTPEEIRQKLSESTDETIAGLVAMAYGAGVIEGLDQIGHAHPLTYYPSMALAGATALLFSALSAGYLTNAATDQILARREQLRDYQPTWGVESCCYTK